LVSTTSAGQSIRDAVEISGNELLRIKLSTAIDGNDTHAKDIKYYSKCYVNNVTSVLRRSRSPPDGDNSNMTAKVEFIDITESALREGKPLNYGSDEIRLIFDRYDFLSSLKEATRLKRQGNPASVYYHITPSTHIAKVTMKKLLSHINTKKELTEYFAQKIIESAQLMGRNVIVSWACECKHNC
jgi:hypothetical protein